MEAGHLNFFEVDECGLYKWRSGGTLYGFDMDEVFKSLLEWSMSRNIKQTGVYEGSQQTTTKSKPKCYVYDAIKDNKSGDYFFVMLKSEGGDGQYLRGVQSDARPGQSDSKDVNSVKDKVNRIWGYPCYYWVIPEENLIVSIKFPHSLTDAEMFADYMKAYVRNRAQHPLLVKDGGGDCWSREYRTECGKNSLFYRFSMHQTTAVIDSSAIRDIFPKVTHLIKRETVALGSNEAKVEILEKVPELEGFFQTGWTGMRKKSRKKKSEDKTINLEYRIEVQATYELVENIIMDSANTHGGWDCVGFLVDNRQVFAHDYKLNESISKPAGSGDIVKAEELSKQLLNRRSELLGKVLGRDKKTTKLKVVGE